MAHQSEVYRPDFLAMIEASGTPATGGKGNRQWYTVQIGVSRIDEQRFGGKDKASRPFEMPSTLRAYVFDRQHISKGTLVVNLCEADAIKLLQIVKEHPEKIGNLLYDNNGFSALSGISLVRYGVDLQVLPSSPVVRAHLAHEPFLNYLPSGSQKDFMGAQAGRIIYAHALAKALGAKLPEKSSDNAADLIRLSQELRAEHGVEGDKLEEFFFCPEGGHIYRPKDKGFVVKQFFPDTLMRAEEKYDSRDCPEHRGGKNAVAGLEAITLSGISPRGQVFDLNLLHL